MPLKVGPQSKCQQCETLSRSIDLANLYLIDSPLSVHRNYGLIVRGMPEGESQEGLVLGNLQSDTIMNSYKLSKEESSL